MSNRSPHSTSVKLPLWWPLLHTIRAPAHHLSEEIYRDNN